MSSRFLISFSRFFHFGARLFVFVFFLSRGIYSSVYLIPLVHAMPLLSSYCLGCAFTPDRTGWWFAIAADPCDKLPPPDHQVLGEYTRKDSCWTLATREKVVDCVKIEAPHPLSLADVMTSPRFEAVAVAAAATPLKVINSYGDAHRRLLTPLSVDDNRLVMPRSSYTTV